MRETQEIRSSNFVSIEPVSTQAAGAVPPSLMSSGQTIKLPELQTPPLPLTAGGSQTSPSPSPPAPSADAPASPTKPGTQKKEPSEEELMANFTEIMPMLLTCEDYGTKAVADKLAYLKKYAASNQNRTVRKRLCTFLVPLKVVEVFRRCWTMLLPTPFETAEYTTNWTVMKNTMVLMWNGSDICHDIRQAIIETNTHTYIVDILRQKKLLHGPSENSAITYAVKGMFGIIHNILQTEDNVRILFREQGTVEAIQPYQKYDQPMVQCKALFCLAYLIDEHENEIINAGEENFQFFHRLLKSTLKTPSHYSRFYGYRATEVVSAINLIASNDANKGRIMASGIVDLVMVLLQEDAKQAEQLCAVRLIWSLTFDAASAKALKEKEGMVEALQRLSESTNEKISKAANSALWIMDGKPLLKRSVSEEASLPKGHVMISYQHNNQAMCLMVRDLLKQHGIKVWMDVDDMSTGNASILEAMAKAVENAEMVLVCYSHKYYMSPNCRLECEYAHQKDKPLLLLRMEYGYSPEGWLGIILGKRFWYDFSQERKLAASTDLLVKAVKDQLSGVKPEEDFLDATHVAEVSSAPSHAIPRQLQTVPTTADSVAKKWTHVQVQQWLEEQGLQNSMHKFSEFDGGLILEFREMLMVAPEFFYKTLRNDMRIPIVDVLKFTRSLKSL